MQYFGTDGIRRPAEQFTPEFLGAVVAGLADYADSLALDHPARVFIAGDTRESTEWMLQDIAVALEACGLDYASAEVLPTPAISYCFYAMGFDFAIDVTASHNPYTDNGIKIFERGDRFGFSHGIKLSDQGREMVERALIEQRSVPAAGVMDRESIHAEAVELYREHLAGYLGVDLPSDLLAGLRIGVDCANGAMSAVYSPLIEELGAEVHALSTDASYGQGINHDCGSTHLENLIDVVRRDGLDMGMAFDGDGDRCLLVDEAGEVVDGDQIIAILANYLGLGSAAITVMANQGLLNWLDQRGMKYEITDVGDQNVTAAMREHGLEIGGEQSGHIVLPGEPTGDGMLTALMVAKAVAETGRPLSVLAGVMRRAPQVNLTLSANAQQKSALASDDAVKSILAHYDEKVKGVGGRLLVRPSGTEPKIRLTVWGDDLKEITALGEELKIKLGEELETKKGETL